MTMRLIIARYEQKTVVIEGLTKTDLKLFGKFRTVLTNTSSSDFQDGYNRGYNTLIKENGQVMKTPKAPIPSSDIILRLLNVDSDLYNLYTAATS